MTGSGTPPERPAEAPHPIEQTDRPAASIAFLETPEPDRGQDPSTAAGPDEAGVPPGASPSVTLFGLFRFTIDGRRAPGLFVAGWIGLILGGSAAFIGLLAGQTVAGGLLFTLGLAIVLVSLVLLGGSQAIERRAGGHAYAGPSPILVLIAVVVGWYVAAIVVGTPLALLGARIDGAAVNLLGVLIQGLVVLVLLRVMVVGTEALTWAEMGLVPPDRAAVRDFAVGVLLAGPVILVTLIVGEVLVRVIGQQPEAPLPPTGTTAGLALNLIAGALIAPVYEELFFRGFSLTAWRRMRGPTQAIIRSALLFAFVHAINQSGTTFSAAFGVALVAAGGRLPVALFLGFVFDRRRSLWASIGLHASFNAVLLIAAERLVTG